jgi:hypothetical protein
LGGKDARDRSSRWCTCYWVWFSTGIVGEERRGEERRGEERRGVERKGEEKRGKERKGEERRGEGEDRR